MDSNNCKEAKEEVMQDKQEVPQNKKVRRSQFDHIHVFLPHTDKYMGAERTFVQPYEILHCEHPKRDICLCSPEVYNPSTGRSTLTEPTYRISSPDEAVMFDCTATDEEISKRLQKQDIEKFTLRPNVLFFLPSRNIEDEEHEVLQLYHISEVERRKSDTENAIILHACRMDQDVQGDQPKWTANVNPFQCRVRKVNLCDKQIAKSIRFLRRQDLSLITMKDDDNVNLKIGHLKVKTGHFWPRSDALKCIKKFTNQYDRVQQRKQKKAMEISQVQPMDVSPTMDEDDMNTSQESSSSS